MAVSTCEMILISLLSAFIFKRERFAVFRLGIHTGRCWYSYRGVS